MQVHRARPGIVALVLAGALAAAGLSAQAVDVTGEWIFDVQTDQGSGTPTITLKQDGEALTGTYAGLFGTASIKGTIKGTAIEFAFSGDLQGQTVDNVYKGVVDRDTMTGTVSIAGGQISGTFAGKKKS